MKKIENFYLRWALITGILACITVIVLGMAYILFTSEYGLAIFFIIVLVWMGYLIAKDN